ncbi:NAD(P)/FAD-dependent oxidoreductase [Bradyrhizobium japonicum]
MGKKVVLIEAGHRLLERATSPVVSSFLLDAHLRAGVEIRLLETVAAFEGARGKLSTVLLSSGSKVRADMVVVGIGGIANDELARKAGLNCTNGVTVSAHGMTDVDGVFACGDCAYHFNRFSKTWTRLESVQNAQDQAKAAGLAIAGKHSPDISVPRFWSDQFDLKLQTTGIAGSFDAAVVRGTVDTGRFSTFYFKDGCLLAVDSINRPGDQLVARRLIAAGVSPSQGEAADISFDLKSLVTP